MRRRHPDTPLDDDGGEGSGPADVQEPQDVRQISLRLRGEPTIRRVDNFLSQRYGPHSRAYYQKLIKAGKVSVNGHSINASYRLHDGDLVEFELPVQAPRIIPARPMDLAILHEDADVLVINKPPGIICHPGKKLTDDTLASGIIHHLHGDREGVHNPGIVHRLDYDTSGVMVLAKHPAAHVDLSRQFESRSVRKEYLALVRGRVRRRFGQIAMPIGYNPARYGLMSTAENAVKPKPALSAYEVRERFGNHTLVSVVPKTGRTHQIRVHFESIGHPLVGERYYRGGLSPEPAEERMPRLALHAWKLALTHPGSGKPVEFTAELPADFAAILGHLRREEPEEVVPPAASAPQDA